MFARIALAHPTVHLTFRSAGKLVHDLPAVTGIKERIAVFFGQELADSLLWVESRLESIHLWGYVAHPSQSRSSAKGSSSSSGAVTSATGRSATRWRRPTAAS